MDSFSFHRDHSRALSGHYAFGFTKMNLQITEIEAFDCIEIVIYLKIKENQYKIQYKIDGFDWI